MTDVVNATSSLPALPTVLRGGAMVAYAEQWLRSRPGRHAGLLLGILPAAAFLGAFFLGIVFFEFVAAGEAIEIIGIGLIGFYLIACTLAFALALATVLARTARRRQLREANARFQPRLQGIKDWFIRGDIAEPDYERMKAAIEPAVNGEAFYQRADETGNLLTKYAALSSLALLPMVPFALFFFVDFFFDGGVLVSLLLLGAVAFTVVAAVFGFVRGSQLRTDAGKLAQDFEKEITRLEEELLRAGHGRKRGVASALPSTGPAYSPYPRR